MDKPETAPQTAAETMIEKMTDLAGEMAEVAAAGQAVGLQILAAELEALGQVIPGLAVAEPGHRATDAEIEANFDNMPV